MSRPKFVRRSVNEIEIAQRIEDGFINGTAMCAAYGKDISNWLKTNDTYELVTALALDLGLISEGKAEQLLDNLNSSKKTNSEKTRVSADFPELVISKRGSPKNGGGTWLHHVLAVQLAQWCNKPFAIQVSRWVETWFTEHRNPITRQELHRFESREDLKKKVHKEIIGQIRSYLEAIERYVDKHYRDVYFSEVFDAINVAITSETARQMRERISKQLGIESAKIDLIRDYFPTVYLQHYISVCRVTANLIRAGNDPLASVQEAAILALPHDHIPRPIKVFEESTEIIRDKRDRLIKQLPANSAFILT